MRFPVSHGVLLLTALGCVRGGDTPPANEQALTGEAFYLERIATPRGSTLEVALIDLDLSSAVRATVAATTSVVENPPYRFTLSYDPNRLVSGRNYGLVALLRDPGGRQLFASDAAEPVPFQRDSAYRIRLLHTPGGSAVDPLAGPNGRSYACGDLRVTARYNGRMLTVAIPGRELRLSPAVSASGARFGDEQNEFWSHGDTEARLILDGAAPVECAATDRPDPWAEAAARGVAFRAVGNEPGWYAEVDRGDAPAIRLVLDYGERRVTVERTAPLDGGNGFRGTADGAAVELRITRGACSDGMSDATYEASAELRIGDRTYRGCGRYL